MSQQQVIPEKPSAPNAMPGNQRRCPYCAEEIQPAAIVCKHCGRDLRTGAVAGGTPGAAQLPAKNTGGCSPIVMGLTLLLVGVVALYAITQAFAKPAPPDGTTAYFMSQQFVSQQLKAPATAKYPNSSDLAVKAINVSGSRWSVTAFVDSQNSFGAQIRTPYVAVMDWLGGTQWKLVSLIYPPL